jgi:hypothetical protein
LAHGVLGCSRAWPGGDGTLWYALPNVAAPKGRGPGRNPRAGPRAGAGGVVADRGGFQCDVHGVHYIAPILQSEAAASTTFVTAMLVLFGVGLTLGNVWGGKAADRSIDRTLILSLAVLIAVLLVFPLVLDWPLPTALAILVWGRPALLGAAAADAGDGSGQRCAQPGIGGEHWRVQPGQRDWRGTGWRGDQCGAGLPAISWRARRWRRWDW